MIVHPVLEQIARKLARFSPLEPRDHEALLSLNFRERTYEAGSHIVRERVLSEESSFILEGFACRHKLTSEGRRQIVSFHVPGDLVDIECTMLKVPDHGVEALTRCKVAAVPARELLALIDSNPRVGRALMVDSLIDASVYREWVVNVGRRPARQRLAHLFCEMAKRLQNAGLGSGSQLLPMTQEQLADATGLTAVHVNRTLKGLEEDGLVERQGRTISIPDWEQLRTIAGFDELYLHLDRSGRKRAGGASVPPGKDQGPGSIDPLVRQNG